MTNFIPFDLLGDDVVKDSEGKPLTGPDGRDLTHEEARFTRAFQAFNELIQKFRLKNPRWADDVSNLVKFKDKLVGDYRFFVAANNKAGDDKGTKVVANAMESLLAKSRKILLDLNNEIVDLNDTVKRQAWLAAWQSVASDAGQAASAAVKPLKDAAEGVGSLGKKLPYIIGGTVLVIGGVLGLLAWRLGPTVGEIGKEALKKRLVG